MSPNRLALRWAEPKNPNGLKPLALDAAAAGGAPTGWSAVCPGLVAGGVVGEVPSLAPIGVSINSPALTGAAAEPGMAIVAGLGGDDWATAAETERAARPAAQHRKTPRRAAQAMRAAWSGLSLGSKNKATLADSSAKWRQ